MNSILIRLQKNSFYILIPVVLFFAYSFAYLIRSILVAVLNPTQKVAIQNTRSVGLQTQSEIPKAVNIYEDMVEGNLIRGKKVVDLPVDPNAAAGAAPVLSEEVPGADEAIVTGTLSGHPSFARATFKEKDKEEADEFRIGEKIVGYKLKAIADHYVVIAKSGLNLKVEIGQSIKDAKAVYEEMMKAKPNAAIAENNGPLVAAERKLQNISRTDFEKYLKNPADLYKDARFGPNLVNGKIDGYKVYQVAVSHIFYQLGARNGDVVKRVNGMPLNDTEKMLEIWAAIKNSQKVTVDLERKEKIITYEFLIRN
jgi:general secretion pathway protein C